MFDSGLKRILFFVCLVGMLSIFLTYRVQKIAELSKAKEAIENHISLWKFDLGKYLNQNKNIQTVEKVGYGLRSYPVSFYEVVRGKETLVTWPENLSGNTSINNCLYPQSYNLPLPGLRVGAGKVNLCISDSKLNVLTLKNTFFQTISAIILLALCLISSLLMRSYRGSLYSAMEHLNRLEKDPSLPFNIKTDDKPTLEIIKIVRSLIDSRLLLKDKVLTLKLENDLKKQKEHVAHDMKNSLSVIEGEIRDFLDGEKLNTTDILEHVKKLKDLRSYILSQKIDLKQKLSLTSAEVLPMVNEAKKFLEPSFRNIKFNVDIPKDLRIYCNREDFIRVLENVLSNSAEAFEGKKGEVNLRLDSDEESYKIAIIDSGKGIPKENILRVFDEDFTHGKQGGRGIGLSYVKKKMLEWGGRVTLNSDVGIGTELGLIFPKYKELMI